MNSFVLCPIGVNSEKASLLLNVLSDLGLSQFSDFKNDFNPKAMFGAYSAPNDFLA